MKERSQAHRREGQCDRSLHGTGDRRAMATRTTGPRPPTHGHRFDWLTSRAGRFQRVQVPCETAAKLERQEIRPQRLLDKNLCPGRRSMVARPRHSLAVALFLAPAEMRKAGPVRWLQRRILDVEVTVGSRHQDSPCLRRAYPQGRPGGHPSGLMLIVLGELAPRCKPALPRPSGSRRPRLAFVPRLGLELWGQEYLFEAVECRL
mmetsp:Transcript_36042/g.86777  ORF Transcript_36042/g.86777 Transcript_36042/m.86777 type:complete len:205 (+) Transcript_36042:552-1166(+)